MRDRTRGTTKLGTPSRVQPVSMGEVQAVTTSSSAVGPLDTLDGLPWGLIPEQPPGYQHEQPLTHMQPKESRLPTAGQWRVAAGPTEKGKTSTFPNSLEKPSTKLSE